MTVARMPSERDSSTVAVGLAVLSVAILLYGVLVLQQVLLAVLVVGAVWLGFLCYLLLTVLRRIAVAVERLADQRTERND